MANEEKDFKEEKDLRYVSTVRNMVARPRSKRLRELGVQGAILSTAKSGDGYSGSGSSGVVGDGHYHANKSTLDKQSDADGYLYLSALVASENDEYGRIEEKVKAGYADEADKAEHAKEADHAAIADYADIANDLTENSPVNKRFLFKNQDDTTVGFIRSEKNFIARDGFETIDFYKDAKGAGIYQDEQGSWHIEGDYFNVRRKLTAEEIEVQKTSHIGGKLMNTAASMICSRVEEYDTYYRCFFNTEDADGRVVQNQFQVDDEAMAQTFNLTKQADGKTGNHFFWRLVKSVGNDYIDLSKSDCAEKSDAPLAGDNIVQLGNRNNKDRQSAIIQDAAGSSAPYIRIYNGISFFTLPEPEIDLNPKKSIIKGEFVSVSTGKSIDEELKSAIDSIKDLEYDVDSVKEQTDKQIVMWFDDYAPTLDNKPASDWDDDTIKEEHVQDLFYNTSKDVSAGGGRAYRFEKKTDDTFYWNEISDKDTIAALEIAGEAKTSADGKRRVFVNFPNPPYDEGDMWTNATYQLEGFNIKNDILVCRRSKAAGTLFDIVDWRTASTATTAFVENLGNQIILAVTDAEDGIKEAKLLAQYGKDIAESAYNEALEAMGLAEVVGDVSNENKKSIAAIQVSLESISALVQNISFDDENKIENINTSGLVTIAYFNKLFSEEVKFGDNGEIINIDEAGFVTKADFAGMFASSTSDAELVTKSEISVFITKDDAGEMISNAEITADKINLQGYTTINGNFSIDEYGNMIARNGEFQGTIKADRGTIGKFNIEGDAISSTGDGYILIEKNKQGGVNSSKYGVFTSEEVTTGFYGTSSAEIRMCSNDFQHVLIGTRYNISNSGGGGFNYAFNGIGDGVLNGMIDGYKVYEKTLTYDYELLHLQKTTTGGKAGGNRLIIYSEENGRSVILPTLTDVLLNLNERKGTPFALRYTIIAGKKDGSQSHFKVYGRHNLPNVTSGKTNDYPRLTNNNGGNEVNKELGIGDILELMLVYNGTPADSLTEYSYQAYILGHRN